MIVTVKNLTVRASIIESIQFNNSKLSIRASGTTYLVAQATQADYDKAIKDWDSYFPTNKHPAIVPSNPPEAVPKATRKRAPAKSAGDAT